MTIAPGRPAGPAWRADAVRPVVAACEQVAAHPAAPDSPPALDRLPDLDGWAVLSREPPGALDHPDRELAPRCATLVKGWREWTAGTALVHHDCRCDNALVDDPSVDALELALDLLAPLPSDAARFAVAMAGMMRRNSMLPPHAGLPTFREWQALRADRLRPLVEALVPSLS